jgi:hypothetical protein
MPEQRYVITCGECRRFRKFSLNPYGECLDRASYGQVMKESDFCSRAELPLPLIDDHTISGLIDE